MDDPREALLSKIDLKACRVELSNSPIVLLCGGKVAFKDRPEDPDPEIASIRHAITQKQPEYEFFRPEEITSWQNDAVFKNLMSFEADLASICTLVVLVLESAGAIAELGAFSQLDGLRKKLIVIKSGTFNDDTSFINLGILRHIREEHETSVKSYPWNINNPSSIQDDVIEDIIHDIQLELNSLPKSSVLKLSLNSHEIVLICELLTLFVALKEKEILIYLQEIGVDINKAKLKGKLFLLTEFKLIKRYEYGGSHFYIRTNEIYHKLRLTPKKDKSIDALRVPIECIQYYEENKDRHRSKAIKEAAQVIDSE